MSLQSRYRFAMAWLPAGWRRNVVVSIDPSGDIIDILPEDVVTTARLVNGAAIPGMPNVHSHAFQRAMVGLAERRSSHADSFWSWRETMYQLASRMTPELLNAVAAQLYADMLKAGYTSVCEFHYLHNRPDGGAYDDPAAMCQALMDAAANAGIGLTLLPALYQTSDFGGAAPTREQQQFTLATDAFLALLDRLRSTSPHCAQVEIGVALHSLRAVPPQALGEVLQLTRDSKTIHIHIAEQEREVEAAQRALARRPIEWLLENAHVDERWCLVHATHATQEELDGMAASGAVIGLCPTTEANLGDGVFPLQAWLGASGSFAIGSDSHVTVSPAEELRWLEYQARLARKRRNVLATDAEPSTGGALWREACEGGARASGRYIGALEAGARADIVVIDLNAPLFSGRTDDAIIDTFVFAGGPDVVRDVMVGGRWLVQDGRHYAETAVSAGYKRAIAKLVGG
ncbi:MAG TPA: formimidoylglutamate deiminase [Steroidobacter sp.]|jgi:formimidoylglutamate deiminase|nr:formimidoylglutamate deiminase [Steroidobacter sp.]